MSGTTHTIQIPDIPKYSLGLQSFYVVGDDVYESEKKTYDVINGQIDIEESGVEEIAVSNEVTAVEYYDLCGVRINADSYHGIVICVKRYADGTSKSEKIIL
ncbi:MAG: hypothetical protein NC328_08215 [Muribaculum sp.]|nr:hypothetical protein [Muribaculum sp.]